MARTTIIFGAVLVVLGVGGYLGSGADSPTALIPSVVGLVLMVLGAVGRSEDKRALTMHIAALVALIGFLGSAMGLLSLPELISGDDVDRPWAVAVQSAMAFVLALYLGLSVRSFIAARQARESQRP